jgi:co-chaperonin GroES (HSP10)
LIITRMMEHMINKIKPVWGRVLVKPDDISETDPTLRSAKQAGIYVPDDDLKKEQYKQIEGELIAAGGDAFHDWEGTVPTIGNRVIYDLYAGINITLSGVKHQIINDTDVIAIITD